MCYIVIMLLRDFIVLDECDGKLERFLAVLEFITNVIEESRLREEEK